MTETIVPTDEDAGRSPSHLETLLDRERTQHEAEIARLRHMLDERAIEVGELKARLAHARAANERTGR